MFNKNTVLVSVGIIFKSVEGQKKWLVVKKNTDSVWELPRITVRKTESSARAVIRMAGEMLAANAQILEEVGRTNSAATINGRPITQKQIFYLMKLRAGGLEAIGFSDANFSDLASAGKKLASKKDKQMLRAAKDELKRHATKKSRVLKV